MSERKELPGIFKTESKVEQMDVHDFVVSGFAIEYILKATTLTKEEQLDAVEKLIARTPNYLSLESEVAYEKIKTALTQETVVAYLVEIGEINTRRHDIVYECGIDEEGSIHVKVFYPNTPRHIRREIKKQLGQKEMKRQEDILNGVMNQPELLEKAKKKLEEKMKDTRKTSLKRIK